MRNFLSNLIRRNTPATTFTVHAIRASDDELKVIIRNTARVYGSESPQVERLNAIIRGRNRHFQPF